MRSDINLKQLPHATLELYMSVTGIEIPSYTRGYHAYCHLWTLTIGQVLLDNCIDKYTVAIVLEGGIVGHVPYNLAKCVSGNRVNHGAGYRMEVHVHVYTCCILPV